VEIKEAVEDMAWEEVEDTEATPEERDSKSAGFLRSFTFH